jgi:hypothetical protein
MKQENYQEYIIKQLDARKALSASTLKEMLISNFKITDDNARQVINRSVSNSIIQASPFCMKNGQYLYYLNKNQVTLQIILEITKECKSPLYDMLLFMLSNYGIISRHDANKITACLKSKSTSNIKTLDDLCQLLVYFNIIVLTNEYIIFESQKDSISLIDNCRIMSRTDTAFLRDILILLQNMNIISGNNVLYRNKNYPMRSIEHNNVFWDAIGYTRTTGLTESKDSKELLVVIDCVISREYTQIDLHGFLSRLQIIINRNKSKTWKVIPILIYKTLSDDIKQSAKLLGFLTFSISILFGSVVENSIDDYMKFLNSSIDTISEEKHSIVTNFLNKIQLSGQSGNLQNMKGDLFESIMFEVIKNKYPQGLIRHSVIVRDSEKKEYEVDYIVELENEIIIFELKGRNRSTRIPWGDDKTKDTLCWFFRKTLNAAKIHYSYTNRTIRACYITTSEIEPVAINKLNEMNATSKLKPRELNLYYDGDMLKLMLKDSDNKFALRIISKYYSAKPDDDTKEIVLVDSMDIF